MLDGASAALTRKAAHVVDVGGLESFAIRELRVLA